MTVDEFAKKYSFKGKDVPIAKKVYGNIELTEDEWYEKLKTEYVFDSAAYLKNKKLEKVQEKVKKNKASKISE
jgi:predicted solute-binding protein